MRRPVLHFSHANGFPAHCYDAMLDVLAQRYRVGCLEAIGTNPLYPVTEGWTRLVEELVDTVARSHGGAPVCGVGHSLGGYLTLLAAVRRPDLFSAIVLLDAPIIGALRGRMLGATKRLGIVDRVTPAGAMRERRSEWATREQASAHFRGRKVFRHFAEPCLDDYVRHALVEREGALQLLIDPAIEYQIYRTIPHDMHRHLGALRVPAGYIGGANSEVVRRAGLATTRRHFRMRKVPGGHLFPLENPLEAAAAIVEMLETLLPRS